MMKKLSLILLTIVGVASVQAGETYHGSHGTYHLSGGNYHGGGSRYWRGGYWHGQYYNQGYGPFVGLIPISIPVTGY